VVRTTRRGEVVASVAI